MKRLFYILILCAAVLLTGCVGQPQQEEVWEVERESVVALPGGETVNCWRAHYGSLPGSIAVYKLSDGTELLTESDPVGPENAAVDGVACLDDLNEEARTAICAYYEQQGLLYNLEAELRSAYAAWQECQQSGSDYVARHLEQAVVPTASNEKLIWFETTVTTPLDGQEVQEQRLGAVFDRETGEALDVWELFALPQQEVLQQLIGGLPSVGAARRQAMQEAARPEYFAFYPEHLELTFPQGVLPGSETGMTAAWEYGELEELLQPWAIPDGTGN